MNTNLNTTTIKGADSQAVPLWMQRYGWLVIAAFVLLQPLGNTFELPIAIMACLGLWLTLFRRSAVMVLPALRPLLLMFACIWLPMLFSLTDAVFLPRAAYTTLVFLRFPLAIIFVICVLKAPEARNRLLTLLGLGLSVAALSFVILKLTGYVAKGYVHIGFPIGHMLAVLSPIYLYWLWRMGQHRYWAWLMVPIYIMAVLFSGARVAWIMLAVGIALLLWQVLWVEKYRWQWKSTIAMILLPVIGVIGTMTNSELNARMTLTAGLLSGNYEQTNAATSLRLPIWKVAAKVAKDHWVNGIGPRGFRYIYPEYVPKDDFWLALKIKDKSGNWVNPKFGPTHPHQFLLEVASETGVIGLLGYLFAFIYWMRLGIKTARAQLRQTLPWMAAVFIAIMPINAHMAFYASFWSCITWWLVAVSLAFWQEAS